MDDENSERDGNMKNRIAQALNLLGYPKRIDSSEMEKIENSGGGCSIEYAQCVSWLSSELRMQCNLEEFIQPITESADIESFRTELKMFLKELRCPYLATIDASSINPYSRLELLDYLCTELQAVRISKRIKREVSRTEEPEKPSIHSRLESTAQMLGVSELVSDRGAVTEILSAIIQEVKCRLSKFPAFSGEALFTDELSKDQWDAVAGFNENLKIDYRVRAEMLLQRLDVTIQSFSWSDRLKEKKQQILDIYGPLRKQLNTHSRVDVSDLLASRTDLTFIDAASNPNLCSKTQSKLQKMMLVGVGPPDRGGRPKDVLRMPQWKERIVSGGGGPSRERGRRKKTGGGKEKRKPGKDDEASSGPSGSVSMTKRSRKKQKRAGDSEGMEISDASQL